VPAWDVEGTGQGALLVLVGLADVEHHDPGLGDGPLGLGGVDLADAGLRLAQEVTERCHA
jgi:hypothetical protein